jgi:hypothetical protein
MGKHVVTLSYWLGAICAVLALLSRALDILGVKFLTFTTKGAPIGFHNYFDAALFFFVISIAAATYAGLHSQKHQP